MCKMSLPNSFNGIDRREFLVIRHNSRESFFDIVYIFLIATFLRFVKGCTRAEEVSKF